MVNATTQVRETATKSLLGQRGLLVTGLWWQQLAVASGCWVCFYQLLQQPDMAVCTAMVLQPDISTVSTCYHEMKKDPVIKLPVFRPWLGDLHAS